MSLGRLARSYVALLAALVVVSLALPAAAFAAVVQMDLGTLSQQAASIAVVRVGAQSAHAQGRAVHGRSAIYTDSALRVERVLKGAKRDVVTLTQPGGTIGSETLRVSDLASFTPGERCIVFLDSTGQVLGGYQGKLDVVNGQVPALSMSLPAAEGTIQGGGGTLAEQPLHADALASSSPGGVTSPAVAGPVVSGISPGDANAGTGTRVTITGSGFGATTGGVTFPNGADITPIPATIVSWGDTQIVCEVPAGAESGISADGVQVSRASDSATSSPFHYPVGFSYSGLRWESPSVTYRVNANCPGVTSTTTLAQIKAAFATWNGAGSTLRYVYGGTATTTQQPVNPDGHNDIYWSTGFPTGVLAWNAEWSDGTTIGESDIVLNSQTGYRWVAGTGTDTLDIQSAVLHELGHTQQLDDQYDDEPKVMSALILGQQRLKLTQAEIDGTMYLWGGPTPTITSSTDPVDGGWYNSTSATFDFPAGGVMVTDGYSWVLDTSAGTVPPAVVSGTNPTLTTSALVAGDNWLHVRARSIFGIWGATQSYLVRVDATPPVTTSDALPSYPGTATITLSATDVGGGVAKTSYQIDGGAWTDGTQAVVGGVGEHQLSFASVDVFGNAETTKTVSFTVGDGVNLSATSLSVGWGSATSAAQLVSVPYGGRATLVGTLTDATGTPMAAEPSALVIAEYLDGATWRTAGPVTAGPAAGQFSFVVAPRVRTTYRLRYLGDWHDAPAVSAAHTVLPAASLSKPSVPSTGRRTRSITVRGVMAPAGVVGSTSTVKLKVYQWSRSRGHYRWVLRKTVSAKLYAHDANSSTYAQTFRIAAKGKWSIVAYAPTNARTGASSSTRSSTIAIR